MAKLNNGLSFSVLSNEIARKPRPSEGLGKCTADI